MGLILCTMSGSKLLQFALHCMLWTSIVSLFPKLSFFFWCVWVGVVHTLLLCFPHVFIRGLQWSLVLLSTQILEAGTNCCEFYSIKRGSKVHACRIIREFSNASAAAGLPPKRRRSKSCQPSKIKLTLEGNHRLKNLLLT